MLLRQLFNSLDATVCPLTSNQPASVHADALANETIFSTELCNCAEDGKCQNTETIVIGLDIKDDND